jgi:hypothetical protein
MPANRPPKRRDFLKTAAAGAAGAMGLSALRFDKLLAQSTGGWVSGMQINPAIDNKRVICCHDTNMLTSTPANTSWANQNNSVNANLVASNLDQMAMQLAQRTTAADAWSTIFRSSKPWASTKVAIKTNAIQGTAGNHPRVAIIKKICDVFIDQLGVPVANVILYDANADASATYSTYASLTDATKIRATVSKYAQSLGGMVPVTIAASTKNISAPADLVNGVIDILVDISVLKVHSGPGTSYGFGSCSLCMKGHLGTFINAGTDSAPSSTGLHVLEAIFNINKHAAILGGNPVRQQLCIVDALLANGGNSATWSVRTDRIVMGTFAPIVDYLAATKLLLNSTVMAAGPMSAQGVTNAGILLPQFLTSFGYAATDTLQWVESGSGGTSSGAGGAGGSSGTSAAGGTGGSGGTSGAGGAGGSGGTSAAGGARSGGTSAAGGARGGGASATGGAGGGRTSATGGTGSGGTSATGGAGSGGTSAAGGAGSGGTSATGNAGSGGTSAAGGAGSGGATAAGGTPGSGGTVSSGVGGTDAPATSAASASGGSASTGGTSAGTRTGASSMGGSIGTTAASVSRGNSGGGCTVAGADRRATRWGALLAFGAVVAEKIRRLAGSGDRPS